VIGASAVLRIYDLTGAAPANTAAAIVATTLVSISLPADWMAAASAGSKVKNGAWSAVASGSGTADFFRIFSSDGTTCHGQGTVTLTGGGGDMTLDGVGITAGQTVTVNTFTINRGNA
jgi:hypothetical protein